MIIYINIYKSTETKVVKTRAAEGTKGDDEGGDSKETFANRPREKLKTKWED